MFLCLFEQFICAKSAEIGLHALCFTNTIRQRSLCAGARRAKESALGTELPPLMRGVLVTSVPIVADAISAEDGAAGDGLAGDGDPGGGDDDGYELEEGGGAFLEALEDGHVAAGVADPGRDFVA